MSAAHSVPASPPDNGEPSRLSLIVPAEMRERIEEIAKRERRSLNQQCSLLLERGLQGLEGAAAA